MSRKLSTMAPGRPLCATGRIARTGLLAVMMLVAWSSAASAATGVVWDLRSEANTRMAPGTTTRFSVWVANKGTALSSGRVTVTMTLPAGLTVVSADPVADRWSCATTVPGSSVVTCTTSAIQAPSPFGAHQSATFTTDVEADPDPAVSGGLRTIEITASGGGAASATVSWDSTLVTATPVAFGIQEFDGGAFSSDGTAFTQAGGHPDSITTWIDLNRGDDPVWGGVWPVEPVKDIVVDLPPGLVGDPPRERCTAGELANSEPSFVERPLCPPGSQVGTALLVTNRDQGAADAQGPVAVYAMVAPPSVPARFGFNFAGTVVTLDARVRSGDDYGLSIDARYNPEALAIIGVAITFWGRPASVAHDAERACPGQRQPYGDGPTCPSPAPDTAFLRNPTSCVAPANEAVQDGLVTRIYADSWFNPGRFDANGAPDLTDPAWKTDEFVSHVPPGYPRNPADPDTPWGAHQLPTGCAAVPFAPTLDARPSTPAAVSTPTAFSFDLRLPQTDDPDEIATSDLRKAVVTLPVGVRVSPSSAYGLAGCSTAQIALRSTRYPSCPDGSRLGTVTIDTPLLEDELRGTIFLAKPHDNPFGSLLAIYLVARGPGVVLKLPGLIEPDKATGQIKATFDNNPQLPFNALHLEFKSGPRAPLVTPDMCGRYATVAQLTSWSGKTVSTTSSFTVSNDGHGGSCPAVRRFAPTFHGGADNASAGATSTFSARFTRQDRDQQLGGVTVEMPPGLLGKIKNITLCKSAVAAKGACGEESRIGSVTVGAGAGSNPFYIDTGRAYITEAYKGGAFGLSIVVPAVAGPFNLGNVNVRAAIHVDRESAALRVVSDPLPTILEGIPLDVRDIRVKINRPDFIVNPTSCRTAAVRGIMASTSGARAEGSTRFQINRCSRLRLRPRMTLIVGKRGRTGRFTSTPLRTVIQQGAGQSNLREVAVRLPLTLNARLKVVERACTRAEYDAGRCERARAGTAVAHTPLLAEPLRGGAYFVKNGRALPDLMIALRGEVDIDLVGRVTIPKSKYLATRFANIPDAPISRFELRLVAGKKGPIGTTANLCSKRARAARARVEIRGHNGDVLRNQPRLKIQGCVKKKRAKRPGRKGGRSR